MKKTLYTLVTIFILSIICLNLGAQNPKKRLKEMQKTYSTKLPSGAQFWKTKNTLLMGTDNKLLYCQFDDTKELSAGVYYLTYDGKEPIFTIFGENDNYIISGHNIGYAIVNWESSKRLVIILNWTRSNAPEEKLAKPDRFAFNLNN